jgi:hypothetical protein
LADFFADHAKQNPKCNVLPIKWVEVFAELVGSDRVGEYASRFLGAYCKTNVPKSIR